MNKTFRRYAVTPISMACAEQSYDVFRLVCEQGSETFIINYTGDIAEDYRKQQVAAWLMMRADAHTLISWAELDGVCAEARRMKIHVF